MKASIAPNGRLRITVPPYVPLIMVKRMIVNSRQDLRNLLHSQPKLRLVDGMSIGKSHSLHTRTSDTISVRISGQRIIVGLGNSSLDSKEVDLAVRDSIRTALRKEAKHYLPKRLAYLANMHGFQYQTVRFSHASSRWGSCSSQGTISLNIALMMLSFEQIDYVLIHELCHTRYMNHSTEFWQLVEQLCPHYNKLRRELKSHTPTI